MAVTERTKHTELRERADCFRKVIEENFIDDNGLLRYNINFQTMRPFSDEELEPFEITSKGCSKADRWTYEDTMFCSGLYLWSLADEYRHTGDSNVKLKAEKFFDDLYELIGEFFKIEPGYIGKPWGGSPSMETTLDQTLYLCFGLNAFHSMTDDKRKKLISKIIVNNVNWWIRRDYRNFQTPADTMPVWLLASHVSAMMTHVYLGYLHSGDSKHLQQCYRLIKEYNADKFETRQSVTWLPVDENGFKVRRLALWHHSMALSLWLLIQKWADRKQYWQERLLDQWHKELKLGLRPDGMADMCVRVNLASETEKPFCLDDAGFVGELTEWHRTHNATGWAWIGAAKSGYIASHIALSACLMADSVPWMRKHVKQTVQIVLNNTDIKKLLWAYDPDGKQVYEKRRHGLNSLTSKGISAWLLTYYKALNMKIID